MPTYAYACKSCGHRFDAVQSFSEPSLTECPECGGALRKQYGSIGVTFNGGGFYRTDSRNSGSRDTQGASSGGAGTSPAPAASSKPETTPASGA
ncbi:FmdB family transcriptional regulator [Microbacterium sp. MEC084]|uniref:FmdB family zinc ribbon protein n=1 Tax=unclassified Microbacterium TaxID=2609290 RepID=UPI0009EBAD01|nr:MULTISPECIES: FmdB family zinc ribbon protein [unclassified Microbacterium]MCD1268913.1 FmdB family transcriptional regulator [Microbacterium sp. MEC084]